MSKYKTVKVLFTEADREFLTPILEQLRAKGLRVLEAKDSLKKNDIVLAALSGSFYADGEKSDQLLGLIGAGAENVLPLRLDDTPVPDSLKNALYARNIIPSSGRDAAHTAERIVAALPQKKNRLPLILSVTGVLLLAIVGLLIWRSAQNREAVPAMAVEEITVPVSLGLTEDDLAAIEDVVIVGDYFGYFTDADFREAGEHWLNVSEDVAYRAFEDGDPVWISMEDGHAYSMTHYDDLRFLELMPNLRFLEMVNVEAEASVLPNLGNASILEGVGLSDCQIDSLDWLSGARMRSFDVHNTQVTDYTPLTSCERLEDVYIDLYLMEEADFSAFAPPKLQTLWISNGQNLRSGLDLAVISECAELRECRLDADLPLADLSFLTNTAKLETLYLYNLHALRDISALSGKKNLRELEIQYCDRLTDYMPIAGCTALEHIHLQCDNNPDALRDASFLAQLPKLRDILLFGCNLRDLNFLEGKPDDGSLCLGFAGQIQDYSGLAFVKHYDSLHLNPRRNEGSAFGDLAAVLPYLEDATVKNLHLHDCGGIDLSLLPTVTENLELWYGDLRDLNTLPAWDIKSLQLYDCQYLTSLDGIENLPAYTQPGALNVYVAGCPRLRDWSAIENVSLSSLTLEGVYSLPVFDGIDFGSLRLESIEGLNDLSILAKLSDGHSYNSMEFVGLDAISDLSPLRRLRISHLDVPPQLAEQAEELVEDGIVDDYNVSYPDGSWQPFEGTVELLSLDELDTLPKSLLRRVEYLAIAGDALIDLSRYEIREDWDAMDWGDETAQPGLLLIDRETGEEKPLALGSVTDLGAFSELTGLRELCLYAQPLETLDGVQNLGNLVRLELVLCPNLTDASAAFALPELNNLHLRDSAVTSIQGVQNLPHLQFLDIFHTRVSDLSPLNACDFTEAYAQGGFQLETADLPCEDFSALSSVREYSFLCLNNMGSDLWADALASSTLHRFGATSAGWTNESFARFVGQHPELEEIEISWSMELTDLTPLLQLENLTLVHLNRQMEEAIDSLSGQELRFELWIDD